MATPRILLLVTLLATLPAAWLVGPYAVVLVLVVLIAVAVGS
jgi:hypothetical protein